MRSAVSHPCWSSRDVPARLMSLHDDPMHGPRMQALVPAQIQGNTSGVLSFSTPAVLPPFRLLWEFCCFQKADLVNLLCFYSRADAGAGADTGQQRGRAGGQGARPAAPIRLAQAPQATAGLAQPARLLRQPGILGGVLFLRLCAAPGRPAAVCASAAASGLATRLRICLCRLLGLRSGIVISCKINPSWGARV